MKDLFCVTAFLVTSRNLILRSIGLTLQNCQLMSFTDVIASAQRPYQPSYRRWWDICWNFEALLPKLNSGCKFRDYPLLSLEQQLVQLKFHPLVCFVRAFYALRVHFASCKSCVKIIFSLPKRGRGQVINYFRCMQAAHCGGTVSRDHRVSDCHYWG